MWIEEIQTQFVRDRLQETSFNDRQYVQDLHMIEQLQQGHQFGWAYHMSRGAEKLFTRYPAEAECIRLELTEDQYIDTARFETDYRQLMIAWTHREKNRDLARQQARDREMSRQQAETEARNQREQELWMQRGGLA